MERGKKTNMSENLRLLPSIDALARSATAARLLPETGAKHLTVLARSVIDVLRRELAEGSFAGDASKESLLDDAEKRLASAWRAELNSSLRRVINATGVVIHTNLGRAPLSERARRAVIDQASGYCSLEYNLETGKRGKRGARAEHLLAELTGAESALIVNNCAAAAFLTLTVLASGGEVVISRGELVEIGGDFRVPDVLEQSGARLREVGTTNRTKLSDYERAITEETKLLLKVHPSNYRIVGFTAAPTVAELAELAQRRGIPFFEDAGSGALFDLAPFGLPDEPIVSQSIAAGVDVVSFSGDKLLGGSQAGIIVGKREIVERIRRHPLYRALRVDKLIYAALEATLEAFRKETFREEIPVLRMLAMTEAELMTRAASFADRLRERAGVGLKVETLPGNSVIGGGSAPDVQPPTTLLSLTHAELSVSRLEERLRGAETPVIARILDDKLLLDLRTVSIGEEETLVDILAAL